MAGSLNKVTLLGNLVRDPEVRQSPDGTKIVTLSVATSEQWRDKATGERKERAEFHRVVIFNERLADVAEKYLTKGRKAYFEGQLQTRKWTDQSGQDRYVTEVVLARFRGELLLLDRGGDAGSSEGSFGAQQMARASGSDLAPASPKSAGSGKAAAAADDLSDLDDDIPF